MSSPITRFHKHPRSCSICLCLISLSIMSSRFICVVSNVESSLFLWPKINNVTSLDPALWETKDSRRIGVRGYLHPLCVCVCVCVWSMKLWVMKSLPSFHQGSDAEVQGGQVCCHSNCQPSVELSLSAGHWDKNFLHIYSFIYFYWSTTYLQYCISFRSIAKWFSYIYIYICKYMYSDSFPL